MCCVKYQGLDCYDAHIPAQVPAPLNKQNVTFIQFWSYPQDKLKRKLSWSFLTDRLLKVILVDIDILGPLWNFYRVFSSPVVNSKIWNKFFLLMLCTVSLWRFTSITTSLVMVKFVGFKDKLFLAGLGLKKYDYLILILWIMF